MSYPDVPIWEKYTLTIVSANDKMQENAEEKM